MLMRNDPKRAYTVSIPVKIADALEKMAALDDRTISYVIVQLLQVQLNYDKLREEEEEERS